MSTESQESFFTWFQASLHITAKYSGNIKRAGFRVRGHLKNDFFSIVRRKIKRGLQSYSQFATRAINNAKRNVNIKQVIFNRAFGKLRFAQHGLNRARKVFDRAYRIFSFWVRKLRRICRIKRCRSRNPYRRFRCYLRKIACRRYRRVVYVRLRVAKFGVRRRRAFLRRAFAVFRRAKQLAGIGRRSLYLARFAFNRVKRAFNALRKTLSAFASFGLGGVFDIKEVSFSVPLSAAATGRFRASIVVSIFRKLKRFPLNINLRNILSFIKTIGERVIHGLWKFLK